MANSSQIDLTYKLIIGLFDAAPGKVNLASLLSVLDDGLTLPQVSNVLDSTLLFTQEVIGGLSQADQVSMIMSHFGLTEGQSTGNARSLARSYFTDRLKAGDSWGQIIYDAIVYLSGKPDARFDNTVTLLNNKVLVAKIYSQSYSDENLITLKSILSGVPIEAALDQASAEVYLESIGKPAGAILLSEKQDLLNGHIFLASRGYTPSGTHQTNTLNDDDMLFGTASLVDKLYFDFVNDADTGDHSITPQLSKIELLNVKYLLDGVGALDLRYSNGFTHINLYRIDDGVTAIIDSITEAATNNLSINRSNAANATIAFTYLDSALQGADDVATLTLNNVLVETVSVQESADDGSLNQGFETLTVISSGEEANVLVNLVAEDVQLLNIVGDQDLTIQAATGTNQSTSKGLLNMRGSLTTIDASTFSGNLKININAVLDAVLDDTSGKDASVTVLGGLGNDTIWLSSKHNTNDVLNGGAGSNTLVFGGGFAETTTTLLNTDNLPSIINFGTLASTNASIIPEELVLELNDTVLDSLVDGEHISNVIEIETLTLRINDAQDIETPQAGVALRLDVSDLTQKSAVNVTLDAGSPSYALEQDIIQLSARGSGVMINNFQTLSDAAVIDIFGGSVSDQIRLSLSDFELVNSTAGNSIAISDFLLASDTVDPLFDVSAEAIVFDPTTGNLFYNSDGVVGGGLVLIASLTNIADLSNLDILIIP